MKILISYIFILVTIYGNAIVEGTEIDINIVSKIATTLEKTIDSYLINKTPVHQTPYGADCTDLDIQTCYAQLMHLYTNNLMYNIIYIFNKIILDLLYEYNVLVIGFLSKYPIGDNDKEISNAIQLNNSKVFCVIGFLSTVKENLNVELQDYIFFCSLDHIKEKKGTYISFKKIVEDYFGDRYKNIAATAEIKYKDVEPNKIMTKLFPELKKQIEDFSTPFCHGTLQWIEADSWVWKSLKLSPIAAKRIGPNNNILLNWQDLEEDVKGIHVTGGLNFKYNYNNLPTLNLLMTDFGEKCKESFLYILDHFPQDSNSVTEHTKNLMARLEHLLQATEFDKDDEDNLNSIQIVKKVQQNREVQDSLSTIFENVYKNLQFNEIENVYLTVSKILDAYVLKVLVYRVLNILTDALKSFSTVLYSYKDVIKNSDYKSSELEKVVTKFIYLGNQFTVFQATWELYISCVPQTLDKYNTPRVSELFNNMRLEYCRCVLRLVVVPTVVDEIIDLVDSQFHRESKKPPGNTRLDSKKTVKVELLSAELAGINNYLTKLVEIKKGDAIIY